MVSYLGFLKKIIATHSRLSCFIFVLLNILSLYKVEECLTKMLWSSWSSKSNSVCPVAYEELRLACKLSVLIFVFTIMDHSFHNYVCLRASSIHSSSLSQ